MYEYFIEYHKSDPTLIPCTPGTPTYLHVGIKIDEVTRLSYTNH